MSAASEHHPHGLFSRSAASSYLPRGLAGAATLAALVYDPRAEASEPKRALGLLLATLGVSAWLAWPVRCRSADWAERAALAFLALTALSWSFGLPAGARDLGTFFAALGAGLLARQLGPLGGRRAARLAALGIGGFSAVFTLAAGIQGASGMSLHGGQGNPNWLGLLLAMTLPLSIDAALAAGRTAGSSRAVRALAWAVCTLQLAALYLSHSRVAWFALSVSSALPLLFFARARVRRGAAFVPLALAALGVLVALALRAPSDVPLDQALSGRVWIWQHSARAARDALPFGAGLGRFAHAYLDAQGQALAQLAPGQAARRFVNATTAHDEYLQAALESGPIAALLLGAALILAARAHALRRWPGAAAALAVCALSSLADSPLRQPAIAILAGLLLGVNRGAPLRSPRRPLATLLALATLGLLALLTRDALRGWLGTRERTLAFDGDPQARARRLSKSARLDPTSGESALALGLARLDSGDARGARDVLERADVLFADTATRVALGRAELVLSRESSAERAFERALAWNFGSFRARLGLAQTLFRQGRLDDAEREAMTARALLPGDPRGRELLDAIREAKMDR